jgi:hypothetical protein
MRIPAIATITALLLAFAMPAVAKDAPDKAPAPAAGAPATPQRPTGQYPGAGTEPGLTWYAQALARGPGGLNVTNFWSKGPYMRAETVIAGHKIITIVKDEWYYAYDATLADGIRVRRTPEAIAKDAPYKRPFGNDVVKLIQHGGERIREENFHGREAEVFQLTNRLGRRTIWASKDALNIPLRIELYNRRTRSEQSTDYIDWLTGLTLPDRYFAPDPVVRIVSYEFEEFALEFAKRGSVGPVPVLYSDLLRGH